MENLVFIVTDSLRKDKLGAYNEDIGFTESIDSFSEEATVFQDAVSQSCWTLPSHASIFTGMYPWEHGATHTNLELDVEKDKLAEIYFEKGYETACFSTNGFLRPHSGLVDGFERVKNFGVNHRFETISQISERIEEWLAERRGFLRERITTLGDKFYHNIGSEMRETEKVIEETEEFVGNSEQFFVFLNLMDAHEPYRPPEEYRDRHNADDSICQYPVEFYRGEEVDFEQVDRHYNASVDYMDDQVGRLFQTMKEQGIWEETVVLVASDHGQMLGEKGHYGHQYSVDENLVSVPLIVKGAGEDEIGSQVELRELYNLIPEWTGLKEGSVPGTEVARGGTDFPDMNVNRIPQERHEELYIRKKFVRKGGKKTVSTEKESGETQVKTIDLEAGKQVDDRELEEELGKIDFSGGNGSSIDEKDEEIKKQLEKLGYG